jgi:hypothetical protein
MAIMKRITGPRIMKMTPRIALMILKTNTIGG